MIARDTEHDTDVTYYQVTVAARLVGISPARVRQYLASGLVQPARVERGSPLLGTAELARLRKIRRMTNDLGLNIPGVEVALRLLDEIAALQAGTSTSSRSTSGLTSTSRVEE